MISKLRSKFEKYSTRQNALQQVRENGFWFVDIPRTSSSSIKAELGLHFGPAYGKANLIETEYATKQWLNDHVPAREMRTMIGKKYWQDLYTFTFVRNPYDRIASLYHYLRKRSEIPREWSFSEFVRRLLNANKKTEYFRFHGLRYGAADFVLGKDGTVLVENIFKYENRSDGIRQIADKLGLKEFGECHVQGASPVGQNYRIMYDDQTRELVSQRFATDLKLFDYRF
ncbi:hypothetical protein C1J05_19745 [Sulfitobacter sp. JL08]|uniref:sulfotransferase family 2 domain-containing protein n=1 Tax=Sulfitobacter sp. JL08 TaxID=2070369 RepID=UPI000E0B838A|nr:sulfotransferase family 2 domain-containing protein [Sulfitobacter sp. JL08]AXI56440.1 hypothetical protein C1J05_19745 [Sulfitobacter sp. JL08]